MSLLGKAAVYAIKAAAGPGLEELGRKVGQAIGQRIGRRVDPEGEADKDKTPPAPKGPEPTDAEIIEPTPEPEQGRP